MPDIKECGQWIAEYHLHVPALSGDPAWATRWMLDYEIALVSTPAPETEGTGIAMTTDDVELVSAWISVSDSDIVDFGVGSEEQQRAAQARLDVEAAKLDRYWKALPRRVRLMREFRWRRDAAADRVLRRLHHLLFPDHEDEC